MDNPIRLGLYKPIIKSKWVRISEINQKPVDFKVAHRPKRPRDAESMQEHYRGQGGLNKDFDDPLMLTFLTLTVTLIGGLNKDFDDPLMLTLPIYHKKGALREAAENT